LELRIYGSSHHCYFCRSTHPGLMIALGVFRVPAHWAGLGTLVLTLPIAFWVFDADLVLLAFAALEGAIIALWPIMIVIVAAIFMYNVAQATGALTTIKNMLSGITTDKRIQVLILVWGFGSFLEAVAGTVRRWPSLPAS
jgi:lactate permease